MAVSDDEFRGWPSSLNDDSRFYRGQREDLATFDRLLNMLIYKRADLFITSRLFRTIEKIWPELSQTEVARLVDEQVSRYRSDGLLMRIGNCHVIAYDCYMPTVEQFLGKIFKLEDLPLEIREVYSRQLSGGINYKDYNERVMVLSFFDPVVSTSYSLGVARRFGKDEDSKFGYVLILNDNSARHCSKEKRKEANCFFYQEDYYDELEYPFWGYANAQELNGFIVDDLYIEKSFDGLLIEKNIFITHENACSNILQVNWKTKKQVTVKNKLLNIYKCH